jgi:hypothetical protein
MMYWCYHRDVGHRTTLTLEDDVMERLKAESRRRGRPFKDVVNEALRSGLSRRPDESARTFAVVPQDLGLREGIALDDISSLLEEVDSASHP